MKTNPKICEHCHQPFECKVDQIEECQCYGLELKAEAKIRIADQFTDCLCRACLLILNEEVQ